MGREGGESGKETVKGGGEKEGLAVGEGEAAGDWRGGVTRNSHCVREVREVLGVGAADSAANWMQQRT